jgi:KTSC domain
MSRALLSADLKGSIFQAGKVPELQTRDSAKDVGRTRVNVYLNPYFHWCAGCWDWVCDCVHCVEPLDVKRQTVADVQIRSVGYDRRRGRLEIEFTWTDDVRQFYPVSPLLYRQLMRAMPMYLFLNRILASRSIRVQRVRTEVGPRAVDGGGAGRTAHGVRLSMIRRHLPGIRCGIPKQIFMDHESLDRLAELAAESPRLCNGTAVVLVVFAVQAVSPRG